MDDLLKEALKLKKKAEAMALKQIMDNNKALESIEKGLSKKIRDAVNNGDKSAIDEIQKKVENFKKNKQEEAEKNI